MPRNSSNYDSRFAIININTNTGDKIKLNLPVTFVKRLVSNNDLSIFLLEDDVIDSDKLINLILEAFKYDLTGEVAFIERSNGDTIKVKIQ